MQQTRRDRYGESEGAPNGSVSSREWAKATYVSRAVDVASAANDFPAFALVVCGKREADAAIAACDQNGFGRHSGEAEDKRLGCERERVGRLEMIANTDEV